MNTVPNALPARRDTKRFHAAQSSIGVRIINIRIIESQRQLPGHEEGCRWEAGRRTRLDETGAREKQDITNTLPCSTHTST